jgi:peroxiredoxin
MHKKLHRFFLWVACVFTLSVHAQQTLPDVNYNDARLPLRLPTVKGDSISLTSFKGKVVLLDFWASWCIPCRHSNKDLRKLYSAYHQQGFEIFGVSLDEEKSDWVKAIKKDKITWPQVIDNRGWEAVTAVQWNVQALPTSYLFNKKGQLVAMNLEREELEQKIKELLATP